MRLAALALVGISAGAGCRESPAPAVLDLMGTWTVVGHRTPATSAMTDAEAKRWHGRTVRLTPSRAVTEGGQCGQPAYTTRVVARDSLLGGEFRLPPGRLPAVDSLEHVSLLEVKCDGAPWTAMGGRLIGIDADRALAPWDGVFFELARGPGFRAIGQEPGWLLVIRPGNSITFSYAYGESTAVTPVPRADTDSLTGGRVYRAVTEASDLRVVIEPRGCTDVMSGEPFETTVSVRLNGRTYQGCGGPMP